MTAFVEQAEPTRSPQKPDDLGPASSPVTLRARGLVVRYGRREVLHGVDLDLVPGEILGLLGPNGAGKTTLIRRLAGLIPSQAGTVELNGLNGFDPATSKAARARLGYLAEEPPLYPDETAVRYVGYMAALAGVPRRRRRAGALQALGRAGAATLADRLTGRLSKGQRQRVGFAAAIVHRPGVILLDEPTSGLDPRQVVSFRAAVRDLACSSAILLSTHLLAEAQAVCDRVVILDDGVVVAVRANDRRGGNRVRVRVSGAGPAEVKRALEGVSGVIRVDGELCELKNREVSPAIVAAITSRGWALEELAMVPDDLEEAFLNAVGWKPT